MKKAYAIILGITAILLAATAAYFSVFGLSKLFLGASLSVIIMAGILEFSKVVSVTFLHQYWDKIAATLKSYLFVGVVILMIITSAGIYGFLSDAYSGVSVEIEKIQKDIELIDRKIEIKNEEKEQLNEQIKTKNERMTSLIDVRKAQETRLDSLYARGQINSARRTETIIKDADENIKVLTEEISLINNEIYIINDSISKYEIDKLNTRNNDLSGEVAPLKYIADITGMHIDKVVNWLILLLIIVFDPMAVALVLSTSSMIKIINKEKVLNKKTDERTIVFNEKEETENKVSFEKETVLNNENFESTENKEKTQQDFDTKLKENDLEEKIEIVFDNDNFEKNEEQINNQSIEIEYPSQSIVEEHNYTEQREDADVDSAMESNNGEFENNEIIDNKDNHSANSAFLGKEEDAQIVEEKIEPTFNEEHSFLDKVNNQEKEDEIIVEDDNKYETIALVEHQAENVLEPNIHDDAIVEHPIDSVSTNSVQTDITKQESKQTLYLKLLKIFYNNGQRKSGDAIPNYPDFKKEINAIIPNLSEKEIKDFLVVCNLFKITKFVNKTGTFEKDYMDAFYLISKI
ncbi:MAG: hypothetical protein WC466_09385 [Candidatus Izemoplasmatales bacterium]